MNDQIKIAFDCVEIVKEWYHEVYSDIPPTNSQAVELLDRLGVV